MGNDAVCSFVPFCSSWSSASGLQEMSAPLQIELNNARNSSRPFPIGLSLMNSDRS